jgi:hypothetical protein
MAQMFQQGSNWGVVLDDDTQVVVGPQDVAADLSGYLNDGGGLKDWYDLIPRVDDDE